MNPIASGTLALHSAWSRISAVLRQMSAWSQRARAATEGRPPAPPPIGVFALLVGEDEPRRH